MKIKLKLLFLILPDILLQVIYLWLMICTFGGWVILWQRGFAYHGDFVVCVIARIVFAIFPIVLGCLIYQKKMGTYNYLLTFYGNRELALGYRKCSVIFGLKKLRRTKFRLECKIDEAEYAYQTLAPEQYEKKLKEIFADREQPGVSWKENAYYWFFAARHSFRMDAKEDLQFAVCQYDLCSKGILKTRKRVYACRIDLRKILTFFLALSGQLEGMMTDDDWPGRVLKFSQRVSRPVGFYYCRGRWFLYRENQEKAKKDLAALARWDISMYDVQQASELLFHEFGIKEIVKYPTLHWPLGWYLLLQILLGYVILIWSFLLI